MHSIKMKPKYLLSHALEFTTIEVVSTKHQLKKMEDLHKALQQHLPPEVAKEVNRLLYGNPCRTLEIPDEARLLSDKEDFDLQAYAIDAAPEQTRPKRLVRIGAIQNKIVLPTTAPVAKQVKELIGLFEIRAAIKSALF